jgi:phosphomannomutase/phosphoglucomutase
MKAFPCSGEINYKVEDVSLILDKVMSHYSKDQPQLDKTDGISLGFGQWRMNIRSSNTEPLLRLNVESRGDQALVWQKVKEIEAIIKEN